MMREITGYTPTAQKLQKAYLRLREQYHHLTLADTKYADQSEELDVIREQVTQHWNALFGKFDEWAYKRATRELDDIDF